MRQTLLSLSLSLSLSPSLSLSLSLSVSLSLSFSFDLYTIMLSLLFGCLCSQGSRSWLIGSRFLPSWPSGAQPEAGCQVTTFGCRRWSDVSLSWTKQPFCGLSGSLPSGQNVLSRFGGGGGGGGYWYALVCGDPGHS